MANLAPRLNKTAPRASGSRKRSDLKDTKSRILEGGRTEFAAHGFNGARIERIARRARCNIRMIYHYYGNKNKMYLAVLEDTYRHLREMEQETDFGRLDPQTGVRRLVEFTFDYVLEHPTYVRLLMNENLLNGRFLRQSKAVPETTPARVKAIRHLLTRGKNTGIFRAGVDPVQLFVSILSLCYVHASNRHTLSIMFRQDFTDSRWLVERRSHVVDMVMSYLVAHKKSQR